MNKKQLTLKLSAIAVSILLASCGGGGGGYYGSTGSSSGSDNTEKPVTETPVATNYHIIITSSKPTLVASGDTAIVTLKLVDVNGGGVANQTVQLAIQDTASTNITIDGASSAVTDSTGSANFTVKLPKDLTQTQLSALVANGITIKGSFTDATKKITTQSFMLNVVDNTASISATAQYSLNIASNKPTLLVTGDNAVITVKAVDKNGGGVSGQNVVLSIPDYKVNGVTINGPSTAVTDTTGNANFTILLPNKSAQAASLIASGIVINAALTDSNGVTSKQTTTLNVSAAQVEQPVANITFGNSGQLQTSTDGTYYTESVSVQVTNIDGKPIASQPVVMSISNLGYAKGALVYNPDAKPNATRQFVAPYTYCPITVAVPAPDFVQLPTTFVAPSVSTDGTVTYTTDATGKFDFQIRYLRRYASWHMVNIVATTQLSDRKVTSNIPYALTPLKTDMDNPAGMPFDVSPYGVGVNCSNKD
ncbi:hypothetical protein NDN13_11685 [Acinetobacter sp. C32I]|uniref:hypothetical protein n=1 Tax=Acinetobacter sp. C32I TaxID=2950074 RepID=UPI0020368BFB|nr:hypothetical protein [Acinetobacter sp. C32I]USA52151.1 hypothetical protein NDN13_11685 [Acinetobacter sp. C32I]